MTSGAAIGEGTTRARQLKVRARAVLPGKIKEIASNARFPSIAPPASTALLRPWAVLSMSRAVCGSCVRVMSSAPMGSVAMRRGCAEDVFHLGSAATIKSTRKTTKSSVFAATRTTALRVGGGASLPTNTTNVTGPSSALASGAAVATAPLGRASLIRPRWPLTVNHRCGGSRFSGTNGGFCDSDGYQSDHEGG